MDETDRRELYLALLGGVAKVAQDRMCASDQMHDWSEWRRSEVRHDEPLGYPKVIDNPMDLEREMNRPILLRSDRYCFNCGKAQSM